MKLEHTGFPFVIPQFMVWGSERKWLLQVDPFGQRPGPLYLTSSFHCPELWALPLAPRKASICCAGLKATVLLSVFSSSCLFVDPFFLLICLLMDRIFFMTYGFLVIMDLLFFHGYFLGFAVGILTCYMSPHDVTLVRVYYQNFARVHLHFPLPIFVILLSYIFLLFNNPPYTLLPFFFDLALLLWTGNI